MKSGSVLLTLHALIRHLSRLQTQWSVTQTGLNGFHFISSMDTSPLLSHQHCLNSDFAILLLTWRKALELSRSFNRFYRGWGSAHPAHHVMERNPAPCWMKRRGNTHKHCRFESCFSGTTSRNRIYHMVDPFLPGAFADGRHPAVNAMSSPRTGPFQRKRPYAPPK